MESMDDQEFERLIQGRTKLRTVGVREAPRKKPAVEECLDQEIADIAQKLNDADSREAAEALIAEINQPQRRKFLLALSQACGVGVGSKDNIGRIEQKLIEGVVGAKLRSQAIKKVSF